MRARLFRYALIMAVVPIASVFLALAMWKQALPHYAFVLLGSVIQVPVVLFCKNNVGFLIKPFAPVLLHMQVQRIPAPYEPDKYKTDVKLCAAGLWLGVLTPVLAYFAILFPETLEITVLNFVKYAAPNTTLLALSILSAFAGSVALALWVELGQANTILTEPGENKRYLYRGFAEEVDDRKRLCTYLAQLDYYEKQEIK